MSFDYVKFGNIIRNHRKKMNYSQKTVYCLTGISIETQRLLENGHREPRLVTLERLSELYKADLVYELIHSRTNTDFFSEEFLDDMQNLINTFDYDGFLAKIESLIDDIKKEYLQDTQKSTNNMKFLEFLESFRYQKFFTIKYSLHNVAFLEQLLYYFSRNKAELLGDKKLYYIEIQIAMILAVIYRQDHEFQKSEDLLLTIINRLKFINNRSNRQNDYFVVAHINLSYVYNRRNEYMKVLETVDSLMSMNDIRIKRTHLLDLLNRKAVALLRLGNENYKDVFTTIFLLCNEAEAKMQYKILVQVFNIHAEEFVDMNYVKGNPHLDHQTTSST